MTNIPPTSPADAEVAEPANGLFGPGIFATGIDLSALDEDTAWRLGVWIGQQLHDRDSEIQQLRQRLAAAEQVCVIYSWTGGPTKTDREKALLQAWMDWSHQYGPVQPSAEWDQRITDLARRRDEIREATLRKIRGEETA